MDGSVDIRIKPTKMSRSKKNPLSILCCLQRRSRRMVALVLVPPPEKRRGVSIAHSWRAAGRSYGCRLFLLAVVRWSCCLQLASVARWWPCIGLGAALPLLVVLQREEKREKRRREREDPDRQFSLAACLAEMLVAASASHRK